MKRCPTALECPRWMKKQLNESAMRLTVAAGAVAVAAVVGVSAVAEVGVAEEVDILPASRGNRDQNRLLLGWPLWCQRSSSTATLPTL